jgi:nickel transport protein
VRGVVTLLGAALLTAVGPGRASAHALGAEAKLKGDRVEVEAYFSDDTPARAASVTVTDEVARTVAEGKTDDAGRWQFPRPAGGQYRVSVDAGDGHKARVRLTIPPGPAAVSTDSPGTDAPGSPADDETVSDGPSRAEFTRMPWERIVIGLGAIALIAAVGWTALRRCGRCRTPP